MPVSKKTFFISDLHLGASYLDEPKSYERRVVRFLNSIADEADELYLLGDILDYWYEYRTVVPRGYIRFFGALSALADKGVKITWFIGNHDIWLFDYLAQEIGLRVVDGYEVREIYGKRFSQQATDSENCPRHSDYSVQHSATGYVRNYMPPYTRGGQFLSPTNGRTIHATSTTARPCLKVSTTSR